MNKSKMDQSYNTNIFRPYGGLLIYIFFIKKMYCMSLNYNLLMALSTDSPVKYEAKGESEMTIFTPIIAVLGVIISFLLLLLLFGFVTQTGRLRVRHIIKLHLYRGEDSWFSLSSFLLAPLTRRSAQRSWWYYWFVRRPSSVVVRRRPSSVNFCFKSLLLLQFLFDNSEFFTGETRHIVPPCNKAGISNFCLEFQKLQKFQISWKRYSSYSSYSKILNFLLEKLDI